MRRKSSASAPSTRSFLKSWSLGFWVGLGFRGQEVVLESFQVFGSMLFKARVVSRLKFACLGCRAGLQARSPFQKLLRFSLGTPGNDDIEAITY